MANTYWQKQNSDTPLFPDLLWSRPESKQQAGKLLIIGGNKYGFVAPAEAFREAEAAGIGTLRMMLPDSLRSFVGKTFIAGELAPSTPSGSFSRAALDSWLEHSSWADGVLLAGDFGHNSETAIVLQSFLTKCNRQITLVKDAVDYCLTDPLPVLNRPATLLVVTMAELQKLAVAAKFSQVFKLGMDLLHLVETLHSFTHQYPSKIIVKHLNQIVVADNGKVSTTLLKENLEAWRVKTATHASVWWLQNPEKPFEALTTAIHEISQ